MGISCCPVVSTRLRRHHNGHCDPGEGADVSPKVSIPPKRSKEIRRQRRAILRWPGKDPLRDAFLPLLQEQKHKKKKHCGSSPPSRSSGAECGTVTEPNRSCGGDAGGTEQKDTKSAGDAVERSADGDVSLRLAAATVSPLLSLFSYPHGRGAGGDEPSGTDASRQCLRCPHCKGCQLHLRYCSGAYGLRHRMHWILNRTPPAPEEWDSIAPAPNPHGICRFEVGPLVVTRHLTYTSYEQVVETLQRGGHTGPFAGVICPRPLHCVDIFISLFRATTRRTGDKTFYHNLQYTGMRAVAAQAKALWELFTFSPERGGDPGSYRIREEGEPPLPPSPPQRVPMDWRYAPWFLSVAPSAALTPGNRTGETCHEGIAFRLWFSERGQQVLSSHVMNEREFWKYPHTCSLRADDWMNGNANPSDSSSHTEDKSIDTNTSGGEVKCSRCFIPPAYWGLIIRRHCVEKDVPATTLRARRACNRRRKARLGNSVLCINQRKTRAQFMALLVSYMMRTTVCGPYKQYLLCYKKQE